MLPMCYNSLVRSATFSRLLVMLAPCAVFLTPPVSSRPIHLHSFTINSHLTPQFPVFVFTPLRTLPSSVSSKSCVCHSYENSVGVGVLFPFRNSPLLTRRFACPLFSYDYNSQISQLPSFDIHTKCPGVYACAGRRDARRDWPGRLVKVSGGAL